MKKGKKYTKESTWSVAWEFQSEIGSWDVCVVSALFLTKELRCQFLLFLVPNSIKSPSTDFSRIQFTVQFSKLNSPGVGFVFSASQSPQLSIQILL